MAANRAKRDCLGGRPVALRQSGRPPPGGPHSFLAGGHHSFLAGRPHGFLAGGLHGASALWTAWRSSFIVPRLRPKCTSLVSSTTQRPEGGSNANEVPVKPVWETAVTGQFSGSWS